MEISVEDIMREYEVLLAQANRTVVLLKAENAKLKEELTKKEGE